MRPNRVPHARLGRCGQDTEARSGVGGQDAGGISGRLCWRLLTVTPRHSARAASLACARSDYGGGDKSRFIGVASEATSRKIPTAFDSLGGEVSEFCSVTQTHSWICPCILRTRRGDAKSWPIVMDSDGFRVGARMYVPDTYQVTQRKKVLRAENLQCTPFNSVSPAPILPLDGPQKTSR